MKNRIALLFLTVAASLLSGCTTAARKNTAMAAAQYGTDMAVVDKLERGRVLSFDDLEELGRRSVPDAVILAHLRRRDDPYRVTAAQVSRLRESGLSDRVINYLLDSRERAARRVRSRGYPTFAHPHRGSIGPHSGGNGGSGQGSGHGMGGHRR